MWIHDLGELLLNLDLVCCVETDPEPRDFSGRIVLHLAGGQRVELEGSEAMAVLDRLRGHGSDPELEPRFDLAGEDG